LLRTIEEEIRGDGAPAIPENENMSAANQAVEDTIVGVCCRIDHPRDITEVRLAGLPVDHNGFEDLDG